jgi:D-3-phosphoglycerate dehydrogenase
MNTIDKVAVCSRSFSRHPVLRAELLARYKNVTFNDAGGSLAGDELVAFLQNHDKAITALERINETVLAQLPQLKVIGKYGVGLDMIDMEAMRRYGKRLGWTGGVNRRSVSEMVISFAIAMLRHFPAAHREVLAATWRQHVGGLLSGRTVGIIGCGFIGKDLIELLQPLRPVQG